MPSAVSSQGSTCGRKRRSHERCASISRCKMEGPLGCFSQGRVTPPLPAGPRVERNRSASLAKALKRREGSWPSANGCHRSPTPQQPSHSPRSSQSSFEGQEPARCGLRGGGNENRPVAKRASDDGSSRVDAVSRSRHRPTFQSFRSRSRSYLLETWFALSQPTSVSVTSRRPYLQSQASAFLW